MSASLVVLGTGAAVQTALRDNTALALQMDGVAVLVDCPGSAALKLRRAGIDPMHVAAVVITHTHLDHTYGLLSLVDNLRLLGRSDELAVFAPSEGLDRLRQLLVVFDLNGKAGFVRLRPIQMLPPSSAAGGVPSAQLLTTSLSGSRASRARIALPAPFWDRGGHQLWAFPVDHGPPTLAVRWDPPSGGRVIYSSDTRPVDALAEFGRGAALFIHEATHADAEAAMAREHGHSTARQAGRLAALARARRLLLVHLGRDAEADRWVAEARMAYSGPIEVPADGAIYPVD